MLACLGDASRFDLVYSLIEGERCVTELARKVGLSQSCTTRHLQVLAREGLVRGERQGKRVVFRLRRDEPSVIALLEWALSGGVIHAESVVDSRDATRMESSPLAAPRSRRASRARKRTRTGPGSRSGPHAGPARSKRTTGKPAEEADRSTAAGPQILDVGPSHSRVEPDSRSSQEFNRESDDGDSRVAIRRVQDLEDYLL